MIAAAQHGRTLFSLIQCQLHGPQKECLLVSCCLVSNLPARNQRLCRSTDGDIRTTASCHSQNMRAASRLVSLDHDHEALADSHSTFQLFVPFLGHHYLGNLNFFKRFDNSRWVVMRRVLHPNIAVVRKGQTTFWSLGLLCGRDSGCRSRRMM